MNRPLFLLISIVFIGCNKYKPFLNQYNFKSENGKPDYSNLNYWAAHPDKHDPSDSIPKPFRNELKDSSVDVFFLHPTTYTQRRRKVPKKLNADIDDRFINAKTDYSAILYQASVFNECRVFAPRYRQAHIGLFFSKEKSKADSALEIAYEDLRNAFEYYLQHWNNGRPIIIASHSQGSKLGEKLLKDFFDASTNSAQTILQNKLVVAYIIGWPVPKEYFSSLKMCVDSLQTGCICGWRTLRKGYIPSFLKDEKGNSFVTNPLSWTTEEQYVSKKYNKGSVLKNFNKIYRSTTDARIHQGFLWVKKPKFPWSFLYFKRNYHIGDINLFYLNIRENVRQRIATYFKH